MNYVCSVRGRKQDLKLLKHLEEHLVKIKTFERRRCNAVISIKFENRLHHVQIHLKGLRVNCFAQSKHVSAYQAIKAVTGKICRQIIKKRNRNILPSRTFYRAKQKVSRIAS